MDSITKDGTFTISKKEFFDEWVKHAKDGRNEALYKFLQEKQDFSGIDEQSIKQIKLAISRFSSKLAAKWESCHRMHDRFLNDNKELLVGDLVFKMTYDHAEASTSSKLPGPGRPEVDLASASLKTKRRRVEDLVKSRSSEELLVAAEVSSRLSGQRNVARLIREVSESPEKVKDWKCGEQKQQRCLTSDEALAYYVDSKSTTNAYKQTRKWSMLAGHHVFPSLYSLRKAKQACLPPKEHVTITETRAEIKLQAVLDKTVERLISAQREVILTLAFRPAVSPAA